MKTLQEKARKLIQKITGSYRPELHYMRGPGPAYARRAVMVEARSTLPIQPGERQ
jgi:hypothetical protein